jgi:penicillin amidase
MRLIPFLFSFFLTVALIWTANQHQPFGTRLPAIGPLLSPFTGFWQQAESTAPPSSATLSFPELSSEVNVYFDDRMVPHIFADNPVDAAFAQGYVTARHRLWQMDISVRATIGRLAEVVGERALDRDKEQRRKGLLWGAERALENWKKNPEEWAMIQAYSNGVNAYIDELKPADYPLEFKLMGYAPEEWKPLNSAVFFKSMAQTLSFRHNDLPATNTLAWLGRDTFDFFFPDWNPKQSPIIPKSVDWSFDPTVENQTEDISLPEDIGQLPYEPLPQGPDFIGSNNWAVSGSKTKSGYPILCNDPHLQLTLPAIWYEVQLHTPQYNAYGVALPGVPGIIIGFNEHIAWGLTNLGHDVLDWYTIKWVDETHTSYYLDEEIIPVKPVVEVIQVKGYDEPILDTVKYTTWGPIVYEEKDQPLKGLAMRWAAHDHPASADIGALGVFTRLMSASNYKDYYEALKGHENPAQNFVFADQSGDIAITVNGRLPIRTKEQVRFIQDGSSSSSAWQGFIPYEHLPRVRNPERGFVSSANQHSTDPSYPYYYHGVFDDYRGRIINRHLDSLNDITPEDMMALQLETYSIKAEEAAPLLLSLIDSTNVDLLNNEAVKALRQWDFRFTSDSKNATLFERWFDSTYVATFDEFLTREEPTLKPEDWRFIELLQQQPDHAVFDAQGTEAQETASEIVSQSLEKVLQKELQGWGLDQNGLIRHLGRIPAFSVPMLNVGGYGQAPNAYKGNTGPSWRMVIAFGEKLKAYGVYPGGQSGNPGSPYFQNMISQWANGQYNELFFFDQEAAAASQSIQTISFSSEK